ncbi:hypothetical protein R6L23_15455 [Streptomyces sp. SR27]|nr:hypothetical protein [Streptomyces sp. SR27]
MGDDLVGNQVEGEAAGRQEGEAEAWTAPGGARCAVGRPSQLLEAATRAAQRTGDRMPGA